MKVLGLDIETGASFGTDTFENFITEVGGAIYDTDYKGLTNIYNQVVNEPGFDVIAPEAEIYTGIVQSLREEEGKLPEVVIEDLMPLIDKCDFIVAHNGLAFDKPILETFFKRYDSIFPDKLWVDSMAHVPHTRKGRSLGEICYNLNIANPCPHRAVFDVVAMLQILFPFERETFSIEKTLEYAKSPMYKVKAEVTFERKDEAKSRGFHWDGPNKTWWKNLSLAQVNDMQKITPFRITPLERI